MAATTARSSCEVAGNHLGCLCRLLSEDAHQIHQLILAEQALQGRPVLKTCAKPLKDLIERLCSHQFEGLVVQCQQGLGMRPEGFQRGLREPQAEGLVETQGILAKRLCELGQQLLEEGVAGALALQNQLGPLGDHAQGADIEADQTLAGQRSFQIDLRGRGVAQEVLGQGTDQGLGAKTIAQKGHGILGDDAEGSRCGRTDDGLGDALPFELFVQAARKGGKHGLQAAVYQLSDLFPLEEHGLVGRERLQAGPQHDAHQPIADVLLQAKALVVR